MPPELIAVSEVTTSILLDKPILLLGRHQECDVQLNSRKVSRRHCCIAQVHKYLVVRDLSSTNGIRINGEKVLEGKLSSGDELTVGNFVFRVKWPDLSKNGSSHSQPKKPDVEDDEDPLESSDDPVLLNDSGPNDAKDAEPYYPPVTGLEDDESSEKQSLANPKNVDSANESNREKRDSSYQMEDQPPSLILPEDIELAPSSDIWPKK